MPAGFDAARRDTEFYAAFARIKQLVADFRANEKFHHFYNNHCDGVPRDGVLRGLDRCPSPAGATDFQPSAFGLQHYRSDARVYDLYALTPAEIKIVEGAS
ncbi:MAG: hypothetical protein WBW41_09955 [Verrucomicrobiia bacterium]